MCLSLECHFLEVRSLLMLPLIQKIMTENLPVFASFDTLETLQMKLAAKFVSLRQMKVNKKVVLLCLRALVPYFLTRPNRVHLCRRNVLAKLRFITSKNLFEPDD